MVYLFMERYTLFVLCIPWLFKLPTFTCVLSPLFNLRYCCSVCGHLSIWLEICTNWIACHLPRHATTCIHGPPLTLVNNREFRVLCLSCTCLFLPSKCAKMNERKCQIYQNPSLFGNKCFECALDNSSAGCARHPEEFTAILIYIIYLHTCVYGYWASFRSQFRAKNSFNKNDVIRCRLVHVILVFFVASIAIRHRHQPVLCRRRRFSLWVIYAHSEWMDSQPRSFLHPAKGWMVLFLHCDDAIMTFIWNFNVSVVDVDLFPGTIHTHGIISMWMQAHAGSAKDIHMHTNRH